MPLLDGELGHLGRGSGAVRVSGSGLYKTPAQYRGDGQGAHTASESPQAVIDCVHCRLLQRRRDLPYAFHRRLGVVYDYITTLVSSPITKSFQAGPWLGAGEHLVAFVGGKRREKG